MEIHDYLVSVVQNITVLTNHSNRKSVESKVQRVQRAKTHVRQWAFLIIDSLFKIPFYEFAPASG